MSAPTLRRARRSWVLLGALVIVMATVALVWFFGGDEPEEVDAERALQQGRDGDLADVLTPDADDILEPPTGDDPEPGGSGGASDPDGPAGEPDDELDDPGSSIGSDDDVPDDDTGDDTDEDTGDDGTQVPDESRVPPRTPADLDGDWVLDTSREFDRAAGLGTFVGYRIDEELSGIGSSTAVGRTPDVGGRVVFAGATLHSAIVEADLTTLESDEQRRDDRVRSHLGEDASARFELDEPLELPEVPPVGEVIEATVSGRLTILDVTEDVEVTLQAVVVETGLLVTGSTDILLSDYGVEPPSAPAVVSVSDEATLEWQLFLVPA